MILEMTSRTTMEDGAEAARRRAIVDKVLARAERHGIAIDPDPVVADLFEAWVKGTSSLKEIREHYIRHLSEREIAKADWRMLSISAGLAQLRR
jgi:hypothetical protein